MQERSVAGRTDWDMVDPAAHKPLSSGGGGAALEPPCDCGGPPPPRFMLPPPPVDPTWAAADEDVCDIVAPYQVCSALTGGRDDGADGAGSSPSLSVVAVVLAATGLLLIVLLIGLLFFCKYRRRVTGLLSGKDAAGKRSDTSRMLYDGLPAQTQVLPNNLRTNGQAPHIEMVAVKGQCHQLLAAGRAGVGGTLFVYPAPPSLTDDTSEPASNMYEEIPFYRQQPPSVSCCSDSDDDVISRPSDDVMLPSDEERRRRLRRHHVLPGRGCGTSCGSDRLDTPPRSLARPPPPQPHHHRRQASADRRRRSPASPGDHSLRRNDPYYYSDILARQLPPGDVTTPGSDVTETYRRPYDEDRRSSSHGPAYCQPDLGQGPAQSPSRLSPLAHRMALDPFVDVYGAGRDSNRSRRHKLGSFRGRLPQDVGTSDSGYMDVPAGLDYSSGELSRSLRPSQWTH